MKKMLLSALLRPTKEGVEAKVAEFPDIKVSAWSIHGALLRLRQAVWKRTAQVSRFHLFRKNLPATT
jgi:hypothetical protein